MNLLRFILGLLFFMLFFSRVDAQPRNHTIDSLIQLITVDSYRFHFDSLRTTEGCTRKVTETLEQSSDHDQCRDYIQRKLSEYLGKDNVRTDYFDVGKNSGLANITAYKNGRSPWDGILIISAHYDSNNNLEKREQQAKYSPGANDNGTGIAALLEIARVLSGIKTELPVLFAAWDIEEQYTGYYPSGSGNWYHKHVMSRRKLKKIQATNPDSRFYFFKDLLTANVNFDMFGHPNDTIEGKLILWACSGDWSHSKYVDRYVSVFNRYSPGIRAVNYGTMTYSDHYTFAAHKIPAVENLESDYAIDPFYHTSLDNYENPDNINFDFAVDVVRGGFAFILETIGLVMPDVFFDRGNEIRLIETPLAYLIETADSSCELSVYNSRGKLLEMNRKDGYFELSPERDGLYVFCVRKGWKQKFIKLSLKKKKGFSYPSCKDVWL